MVAAICFSASSTRDAAIEPFEIFGERAQRLRRRHLGPAAPAHGRDLDASPPNSSTSNPNRARSLGVGDQRLACVRRKSMHTGIQQPLALERPDVSRSIDPLEEDALVRDVLVDDGDALVVHGDDERVAELPERNHRAHRTEDALDRCR